MPPILVPDRAAGPAIAQWNLTGLAEAMLPLFDADQARAAAVATIEIERFADSLETHWLHGRRAKLGVFTEEEGDRALVDDLLAWMHRTEADFTNTFRDLLSVADATWLERLKARRARQPQSNPAFIPRNHKVEEALYAATGDDFSVMERLLDVLRSPYDYSRDLPDFGTPSPDSRGYRTFCGT